MKFWDARPLLACKDARGAAFCCGTSAVFRVEALLASGGMAIETVTEDMLTSFKFDERSYRTVFLNERLSMGLAPGGSPPTFRSGHAGALARFSKSIPAGPSPDPQKSA
jgi:cellulose synthase/poly-beta-1,6-N-acetylglucosamine synthase-like glycosyltransferase